MCRDQGFSRAAEILTRGGVVAVPTDTVYGLAAHPDFSAAIERIKQMKGRDADKPIALLASDISAAARLGLIVPPNARLLAEKFLPGALTLVLARADGSTEGVRVPDHPALCELIAQCGGILRVTSANISGESAARSVDEIPAAVARACDLVIDGGRCVGGVASSVVKCVGGEITILREGALCAKEIYETCNLRLQR